jgi:Tol biopolymer transport system component
VANDTISINKVNIQTLKTSLIYGAANKNPYGLTVLKDKLIVSLSSEDKDETKLVEMDIKGNITKEIVSEKGIIYYPTVSKDQTKIAYLVKNTISTDLPGTVYTTDFLGKNKQKITDASQIIAWQ